MRTKPLTEESRDRRIKDRKDVLKEIAHLHTSASTPSSISARARTTRTAMTIAQAVQGGLGMPDRDYYTKQDADMKEKRERVRRARDEDADIVRPAAGKSCRRRQKNHGARNEIWPKHPAPAWSCAIRKKNYNKMRGRQLQKLMPDWKWGDYFKAINCSSRRHQRASAGFLQSGEQGVQIHIDRRLEDVPALAPD